MVTPVNHRLSPETPAVSEISSNFNPPLLRYNLLETIFPVKNRSINPSLFKSPAETPAPIYIYA